MSDFLNLALCPEWRCSLDLKRRLGGSYKPVERDSISPLPSLRILKVQARARCGVERYGKLHTTTAVPSSIIQVEALLVGEGSAVPAGEHANRNAATSLPIPRHALYSNGSHRAGPPMPERSSTAGRSSSVRSASNGVARDSSELEGSGTSTGVLIPFLRDLAQKESVV